ncbi:MAG: hypothetical protein U5K31_06465 [Balneolaceae bacterium]|nr:hypothetical protein [Balneolaceae bacterium]
MSTWSDIEELCGRSSEQCDRLVDEFLLYYAAQRERLDREMDKRFARFRHVTRQLPASWENSCKAQYIAYRLFREGGLIRAYLKHAALQGLSDDDRRYLEHQADHPWRFSFSQIVSQPERHFFEMKDVFTGDTFLLYSPGTTRELQLRRPVMWFNLLDYNGSCWQTYGPICPFWGFEPEDILFYFRQLRPRNAGEDPAALLKDLDRNPVPYMALFAKSQLPLTFHKNHQFKYHFAEYLDDSFDSEPFKMHFRSEYAEGVYRFTSLEMGEFPHFATVFYEEDEELLTLYAHTAAGFEMLIRDLNSYGYELLPNPDICVNIAMHTTAQTLLGREITILPYGELFREEVDEVDRQMLDKMNTFFAAYMEDHNAGKATDIEHLAKMSGLELETARDLVRQVTETFRRMGG